MSNNTIGTVGWLDLTVDNANDVKDFYQSVIGWESSPVNMGDYDDYSMKSPSSGNDVAGICHKKGSNSDMPSQWMPYFIVGDIEASLQKVGEKGGKSLTPIKSYGESKFVVIQDPAGAVCALYQE